MKTVCLMLAGLLVGCGNGGDSSTRIGAAFLTTPLAARLAAEHARREATPAPTTVAARTQAPAVDAFHAQVRAIVDTPSETGEPADVDAAQAASPEDSEPVPL